MAKVIAASGLCSRREAEAWIAAGRVAVNGAVLATPACVVGSSDVVTVDGRPVPERPVRLWRYHKPAGLVTTHADPQARPTVFDRLPSGLGRVISVGRLDLTSEGLAPDQLGPLARRLELPATAWIRRYRVRAHGSVTAAALATLAAGITIDGIRYGPIEAVLDRVKGSNVWLTLALKEGKNREVRNVLTHLGLRRPADPHRLRTVPARRPTRGRSRRGVAQVLREQLGKEFVL